MDPRFRPAARTAALLLSVVLWGSPVASQEQAPGGYEIAKQAPGEHDSTGQAPEEHERCEAELRSLRERVELQDRLIAALKKRIRELEGGEDAP